ncbi:MAG: aminopeptidase P family protein [Oscillospiraceae bacterium]|nr:aminopeptidase P family protein [Oscillospiraceae bacterium]MBR7010901.1 aminopeptidase P family protein [Oscillospiraceae bacterium]
MTNLEKYLSLLDKGGYDGLLLTSPISRKYCAEFNVDEGVAIVTKKGCRYFTDSRYIETAEKNLKGFEVRMVSKDNGYIKQLNEAISEFEVFNLGFEEDFLTVAEFRGYEQKLNAKLVPCQKDINAFRVVKEAYELQRMREAQAITDKSFTEVCQRIKVGMTEKELCAELIYCLYKNGAEGLSFAPIVVSGPNSSMPHGVPGERKLQPGDFITMDFGVVYKDYCSDMTRTVALGYATDEMKKVYDTVLQAQLAGIAATRAGVTGQAIDGAARKVIADAGYGAYFGHGYGHCLGLQVHEAPNCNPSNDKPMPAGCVSSAEPGIYLPGKFGVRIEDCVIIQEDGVEDLAHSPKNLIIIEA